jgi:hypothetical protein
MKTLPHCFLAILFVVSLTTTFVVTDQGFAQNPPCIPVSPLPSTNGAAWAHGATVTVIINSNDFPTSSAQTAVQNAFLAWQNANTNAGVTFVFTTGTAQPSPGQDLNTHYVSRSNTPTPGETHIAYTGSPTTEGNVTTSAVTNLNTNMTDVNAIRAVMAHEIGHTFGLDDCLDCEQGSTIMSRVVFNCFCSAVFCDQVVPYNGAHFGCPPLTGPTDCDATSANGNGNYPAVTPTPTPTPTPCADQGQSCYYFLGDCCPGLACGNLSNTCIPCEPNPQSNDEPCMSEQCASCYANGGVHCTGEGGNCWTPIVIDVAGNGFNLTNATNGVNFDDGFGSLLRTAWTAANSDDSWLVLDRNGNGKIDNATELFGNAAPQPVTRELRNGFRALAEYDKTTNGGDGNEKINKKDAIFDSLRLWRDINHDGITQSGELQTLPSVGLRTVELDYKIAKRKDNNGNTFKWRSKVKDANDAQLGRWAWDVFLDARPITPMQ